MRKHLSWLYVVALAVLALILTPCAGQAAPTDSVVLPGHVAAMPRGASFLGHVAAAEPIKLSIVLPLQNRDALADYARRVSTPGDPLYDVYLTADEFNASFSPSQADYDAVKAYAISQGLTVVSESKNRITLGLSGPAANVEKAFGVTLNSFQAPDGRVFHQNTGDPSVPAELGGKILAIQGLSTANRAHPHFIRLGGASAGSSKANMVTGPNSSYFSPANLPAAYSFNSTSLTNSGQSSTLNGAGQTIALAEFGATFSPTDFTTFASAYSSYLPASYTPSVTAVAVNGFSTTWDSGVSSSDIELALDVDCVVDAAPAATILVFEANDDDFVTTLLNAVLDDGRAKVLSISYGWAEDFLDASDVASEAAVLQSMQVQGITVFGSTGDSSSVGDYPWYKAGYLTSYDKSICDPSSEPLVTAVGGTSLSATSPWTETVWNWYEQYGHQYAPTGGGGGVSVLESIPSFQKTYISNFAANGGSTSMRNIPDVALNGDPNTGYNVYENGSWSIIGGTSASSPVWASLTVLANEQRSNVGLSTIGFLNSSLYGIGASSRYSQDFHDITTGDNIVPNSAASLVGYSAVTGYDLATGWGTPIGANLIADLAPPAPTLLNASVSSSGIALSWSGKSTTSSYRVYRGTASGAETALALTTGKAYTDASPISGQTYYYEVAAVTPGAESAKSNEASAKIPITLQVATPIFSPAAGTYPGSALVTLADTTSGATIYYTTDGSTPTTSSTVYSAPFTLTASATVNAIAVATGYANSAVGSATYTITPIVATPTFSLAGGSYTGTQSVTLSCATAGAKILYTVNGGAAQIYSGPITVSVTSTILARGVETGYVTSALASATYTITPIVATPTFSLAGGSYTGTQTVTLSCATAGAKILYTVNGGTAQIYSGSITLGATSTILARGVETGYVTSALASATYTITAP